MYKGKPILYSLGNFVHDLHYQKRPDLILLAMLVRCHIHDGKLQRLSFVPGLYKGNGPRTSFNRPRLRRSSRTYSRSPPALAHSSRYSKDDVAVTLLKLT